MEIKMNKRKTLFLSPHFPPYKSGLSDYSRRFSDELKKYREVDLIFGCEDDDWKGAKLLIKFYRLLMSDADTVLIQYVPYMYGKRGINFQFPLLLFLYSLFNRKRIELMVHEYNYPFLGDLKSGLLCGAHLLMGRLMLLSANQVFCSSESLIEILKPKSLCPIIHLPVGSNILKENQSDYKIKELGLKKGEYLCLFGGFHPSKDQEHILNQIEDLSLPIVHIGVSEKDYQGINGGTKVIKTGFLRDSEVAEILSNCRVLLTYFLDGATLRRGSLLAGIELGCQVLTNLSSNTEDELKSCKNIYFSRTRAEYGRDLKALLDGGFTPNKGENPFSWKRIIHDYLLRRVG